MQKYSWLYVAYFRYFPRFTNSFLIKYDNGSFEFIPNNSLYKLKDKATINYVSYLNLFGNIFIFKEKELYTLDPKKDGHYLHLGVA